MKLTKVTIRWTALESGMWYEDMEGQTFYVIANKTLNYYTLPVQNKIIFKIDAYTS